MRRVFPHLFCLLACGLAGIAAAQTPVVSPQWSVAFNARERVDEIAFPQSRESWAQLADGKTVLVSRNLYGRSSTLRAFGSDGQVIESRHLGVEIHENAWLAPARQGGGVYVLSAPLPEIAAQYTFSSYLRRYSPGSAVQQIAQVFKAPDARVDPAQALQVLDDDSVLVLNQYSVGRIGANGATQWFRYSDPVSAGHFQPLAMAQGPDGVFWLAGHGGTKDGGAAPAYAAVWRLRADGTFLSTQTFRCAGCSDSRALGIRVLPDGRAVAVGRGGTGEPGFIALFEGDGSLFRRVDTAPDQGFDRVIHDQAGHVYLFARDRQEISAIDAGDGTLRWTRPGSDVAALETGVLISRAVASPSGALVVDAYDTGGQLRWSRQLDDSDGLAAGGAELGTDSVIRVFSALAIAASGECGSAPRLHELDLGGTPLRRLAACLRDASLFIAELDTVPGAGVMVDTGRTAEVRTLDGRLAWRYLACEFCNIGYSIAAVQLLPDRSAWLLVNVYNTPLMQMQSRLLRVSAEGLVLLQVPMTLPAYGVDFRPLLLGDAQQVIVFAPGPDSLERSRYTAGGELRETLRYEWSEQREGTRLSVQPLKDGGVTLRALRFDTDSCQPSPPVCGPRQNTLLRLDAEGKVRWRQELGHLPAHIGLESDGGAVVLYSASDVGGMSRLRHVDAAKGTTGAEIEIADSASNGSSILFSGPVAGRYLLNRVGNSLNMVEIVLVDRSGAVLARRDAPDGGLPLAHAAAGFLVGHNANDAQLLSAQDLTPLAIFTMGNVTPNIMGSRLWSITDDGDVYSTERLSADLRRRERVSRFALPGTPAAEVIFIARFD